MGCQQSIPSSTTTDSNKTTSTPPPAATTTATTTPTPATTTTTEAPTNGATTTTSSSATPITTNTLAESATNTTTTTTTMAPTQAQSPHTPQQRQPARNIFAKPLLQNVVTTAITNTATTTAQTAHQHVQNITQAIGTMMTNVVSTATTTGNTKTSSSLPHYEKSNEINQFLMDTLQTNFVFEHCSHYELQQLCYSMEPYPVNIGTMIIQQGAPIGDYFYMIYSGTVTFIIDDHIVGTATKGQQFGELSLLYSAPRAATVMATSSENNDTSNSEDTNNNTKDNNNNNNNNNNMILLYRLDQITFRTILQQQTLNVSDEYMNLLRKVKFLTELDDYNLYKLSSVLQKHTYTRDTIIVQKGDINAHVCYILLDGIVTCSEISVNDGSCTYSDIVLSQPGDYFGERAIITGEPRAATVTATSNSVTCYTIDKITFDTVLGNYQSIISKANEERLLSTIPLICSSKLPSPVLKSMTQLVKEKTYPIGTTICHKNEVCEPALYIIRTGHVTIHKSDSADTTTTTSTTIGPGGYFGDDQLLFDITKKEHKLPPGAVYRPSYTVVAGNQNNDSKDEETLVTVGILTLAALRTIMDTQYIGQPIPVTEHKDSLLFDRNIVLSKLQRHTILGAGTFGMVYLVSRTNAIGERVAYALKVQSKYELIKEGQALAVICEKNIMAKLQHPFLIGLINTYHDDTFVYILLQLIQGGELYSYIHTKTHDYLPEESARFYAACIGEGLGYMHKQGYVYRDTKPENVLVDHTGYCVIIDFGFAKYVPIPTKTFTLCGTPLYIAPEVILNRGHNSGADHWSYGMLIYEMLFGSNPFYKHGMDQMDLFRGIVKARYVKPMHIPASDEGHAIIKELLTRDPNQRLGNLAAGEDGILYHPWFSSYNIDMDELRTKKYTAPVIPTIKDPLDSSNFENWDHLDDKTKKKYPPVSADDQSMFDNF